MTSTVTRTLNGLTNEYKTPVVTLAPTSLASQVSASVKQLLQLESAGTISTDRIKFMLEGKTQMAVDLVAQITDPGQRKQVLSDIGQVWEKFYHSKHLNRLMHGSAGTNPYADLIAAYGDTAMVGKRTTNVVIAAQALDKKLGIDPTIGVGIIAR